MRVIYDIKTGLIVYYLYLNLCLKQILYTLKGK